MIYLMRHGESPENVSRTLSCLHVDEPLTDRGIQQANQAAAWLADRTIRRIYASPMIRAKQTASIVGRRLGLVPLIVEELRQIDCGALEGRSDPEAWQIYQQIVVRWVSGDIDAGFEGGETGWHASQRFARFIDSLPPGEGDVLVVAHLGIFAWGLLRLCFDLKAQNAWDLYLPNTGMVVVERTSRGYSCVKWGLSEHLDRPSVPDVPEQIME